jgi:hypothetical protein
MRIFSAKYDHTGIRIFSTKHDHAGIFFSGLKMLVFTKNSRFRVLSMRAIDLSQKMPLKSLILEKIF